MESRWDRLRELEMRFYELPRNSGFNELSKHLEVLKKLGNGQYAQVYKVAITSGECVVAMKRMRISASGSNNMRKKLKQLMGEELIYCYLNALVLMNVCPNFSMLHRAFLSECADRMTYYMFMELAHMDMSNWFDKENNTEIKIATQAHTRATLIGIFQVCVAVLALNVHLDCAHNDLYLKNILIEQIEPQIVEYHLSTDIAYKFQMRWLFKVSDFGIAQSGLCAANENIASRFFKHRRPFAEFEYKVHVLEFDISPTARDLFIFFHSILQHESNMDAKLSSWLKDSLEYFIYCYNDHKFVQPRHQTLHFIKHIFGQKFLKRFGLASFFYDPHLRKRLVQHSFYLDLDRDLSSTLHCIGRDMLTTNRFFVRSP